LEKGYTDHGMVRRSSSFNTGRIDHLYDNPEIHGSRFYLHYGDLTDSSNLNRILERTAPDEVYNLAAQSFGRGGIGAADQLRAVVEIVRGRLGFAELAAGGQGSIGTAGGGSHHHE
jgi:hypothetical protein